MDFSAIPQATKIVFEKNKYKILAVFLTLISFFLYVSIPVLSIPGNSYQFFFSATSTVELFIIVSLSAAMGITFTMQIYSWQNNMKSFKNASVGFAGFMSGALSAAFSSATCASCISVIFSFLGFGGVIFLIERRTEITVLTTLTMFLAIYLTAKRITGSCTSCTLPSSRNIKTKV